MPRIRPFCAAVALATLPACAALLGSDDWPLGAPPPPLPVTGYFVDGEVRDVATLAPVGDAEVVLVTDRRDYAKRTRSDAGGRFSFGFSALAREVTPGDVFLEALLLGDDPSDDVLTEFTIRVNARGWLPAEVTFSIDRSPGRVIIHLRRAVDEAAIPTPVFRFRDGMSL